MAGTEHVVLLDGRSRAVGTLPKAEAHTTRTPLHLAFSCHVVDRAGRVLTTQRARTKSTWPGAWTNACCGHPQLGETLRDAVERRVKEELGLAVVRLGVAVPDFTYRAEMTDGTAEHERCPVVVALVDGEPVPDPAEVAAVRWRSWDDVQLQAERSPGSLSPWAVAQVRELAERAPSPGAWLDSEAASLGQGLLDRPIELGARLEPRPPEPTPVGALAAVARPLHALLEQFLADKAAEAAAIDPALAEVTDEVRGLVAAGGKRLRPAFVHWGHRATGAPGDPAVLGPAAAVELLHTFALLHDDVMDRSPLRRGRPSAHAALAERHRQMEGLGDASWFGASAAILAGDLTYVWADQLFDDARLPADALTRARQVFTTLREEVIAGQYLDLLLAADRAADERRAGQVALLKSARYTVTRPLLLGAALGPPDPTGRLAEALQGYGDAVGLAFQLRDDILGLFGDPVVTGKSDLDDLREGKRTLLILRAQRLADAAQRSVLDAALGDPELDDARAARVRQVVCDTGALGSVEARVSAEHAVALDAIGRLPEPAREALAELADQAIRRWA